MKNRALFSIPAEILLPSSPKTFKVKGLNKFISLVKLKVFYEGTTPDNREFSSDFSNKVLASLPQTPVVGYHDGEDFVGHNDVQYVYGYVPEVGEIGFEMIDGKKWAVVDIVLFTGREDNIGEVASQILGKRHSLELSSDTSYKVVDMGDGNRKLVFMDTSGVVGLSVLGDNENPAFTGSEFFKETQNTLEKLIREYTMIKEQNLLPLSFTESFKSGGAVMDLKLAIAQLNSFMKATFSEIFQAVQEELLKQNDFYYVMEISENMVVYFDFSDGTYWRAGYTIEDSVVTLGAAEMVKVRFLTDEEINKIFTTNFEEDPEDPGEDPEDPSEDPEDPVEDPEDPEDPSEDPEDPEEDPSEDPEEDPEEDPVIDPEELEKDKKRKKDTPEPQFTKEELEQIEKDRIELEAFRTEKKLSLIKSLEEYLTNEEIKDFTERVSEFTYESLEKELSVLAIKNRIAKDKEGSSSVFQIQSMSKYVQANKSKQDKLAKLVAQNK